MNGRAMGNSEPELTTECVFCSQCKIFHIEISKVRLK